MKSRIHATMIDLLVINNGSMEVRDHDGKIVSVSMRDVEQIMQACQCSQYEALDRLADWVLDKVEGV